MHVITLLKILFLTAFLTSTFFTHSQVQVDSISKPCIIPTHVNEKEVYLLVEEMPIFPDGTKNLYKFIRENFKKPSNTDTSLTEIYLKFIVNETGKCIYPCVMAKGRSYIQQEVELAAIDLFNKLPIWTPGKQRGKNENVIVVLKINLKN